MKIHTYYEDFGLLSHSHRRLLDLWISVWRSHGWEPVVLGMDDAKRNPRFNQLRAHAYDLPTVNGKLYEMACYHRWAAYAITGGIAADYDVFPRVTFPPTEFTGFMCGELGPGVGFMSGAPSDYEKVITALINYQHQEDDYTFERPHVSDMIIIHKHPEIFDSIEDVSRVYGTPGWEHSRLVHFANAHMKRKDLDRADEIRSVLCP